MSSCEDKRKRALDRETNCIYGKKNNEDSFFNPSCVSFLPFYYSPQLQTFFPSLTFFHPHFPLLSLFKEKPPKKIKKNKRIFLEPFSCKIVSVSVAAIEDYELTETILIRWFLLTSIVRSEDSQKRVMGNMKIVVLVIAGPCQVLEH